MFELCWHAPSAGGLFEIRTHFGCAPGIQRTDGVFDLWPGERSRHICILLTSALHQLFGKVLFGKVKLLGWMQHPASIGLQFEDLRMILY